MKKRMIFSIMAVFCNMLPTLAQFPIYRSTATSTSASPTALSQITPSILFQTGNYIGLGTSTPSQRLTLKFHQEIQYVNGVPASTTNVPPTIRFENTTLLTPAITTYWHLVGGTSFALQNPSSNITPINVASDGEITLMHKLQLNVPSLNASTNTNFLGFDMSSNIQRRIYWTSRVNGVDNQTIPLEFMFDARELNKSDVSVMKLMPSGQVRIGDENTLYQSYIINSAANSNNAVRLSVEGNVAAQGFIATQQNWADYVFYAPQNNPTLAQEEQSIKENCTLVGVPTEQEAAQGRSLAENDALLLEKVEQLYLHVISLNKEVEKLQKENAELKALIKP